MERLLIMILILLGVGFTNIALADDTSSDDAKIENSKNISKHIEQQRDKDKKALERSPAMQKRIKEMTLPAYKMDGTQDDKPRK